MPMNRSTLLLAAVLVLAACGAPAPPAPVEVRPVAAGPTLLRPDITLRRLVDAGDGTIRLAQSPTNGTIYTLHPGRGLLRLGLADGSLAPVASATQISAAGAQPTGMAFGPDGALYVVANLPRGTRNQGLVTRGTPSGDTFIWVVLATTESYPLSGTQFDHMFNGVAVSPDGRSVFVNSGSRTDHGEIQTNGGAYPDTREVPLTSAVLRLPADATDLSIPADADVLAPYLFADGLRNAYDLAFAPDGQLFAVDNGPDADYPDELNALVAGRHYGFPWRFGAQANAQADPAYDPAADRLLHDDYVAVQRGTYANDPTFPPPPGPFSDPIVSKGPAAATYRASDGSEVDAPANGEAAYTFTPHRSPLGLVFAQGDAMPADLRPRGRTQSAFVLSWGTVGGTLSDRGQDLLHLTLTPADDGYTATATQVARDFKRPIDAILDGNRLYVLEFDPGGALWELTFGAP